MINSLIITFLAFSLTITPSIGNEAKEKKKTSNSTKTILFLGDSLTEGYGINKNKAYPELVKKLFKDNLNKNIKILNGSVSGSTTASGFSRFRWFLKSKPDILFLALGANDGLRGIDLTKSKKNLAKIIKKAKELNIQVVLAGMLLPMNYGEKYRSQFENMYIQLEEEFNIYRLPFLLKGVAGIKKYNLNDQIHPNEDGHKIMAQTVYNFLKKEVL